MPHELIDDLQRRKGQKVALFLTFENATGLILGVLPCFLVTMGMPFFWRALIVLLGAGIGYLATLDVGGLAFYERLLWTARGAIAARLGQGRVTPDQLVGARSAGHHDPALPVGGPVRAVRALPRRRGLRPGAAVPATPARPARGAGRTGARPARLPALAEAAHIAGEDEEQRDADL